MLTGLRCPKAAKNAVSPSDWQIPPGQVALTGDGRGL
jgi:hypothetical protein